MILEILLQISLRQQNRRIHHAFCWIVCSICWDNCGKVCITLLGKQRLR